MLRRSLSGAVLSFALTVATLTLAAHVLATVAFDPGRPGRVLAAMLSTPEGNQFATEAIADHLKVAAPDLPGERASLVAGAVAADPELAEALRQGGGSGTATVDTLWDTVARSYPKLAASAREQMDDAAGDGLTPSVSVGVRPAMAGARTWLGEVVTNGVPLALVLAGAALLVGPGRDRMLRRMGRWACASSMVGVVVWFVVPRVLPRLEGRWPVVVAAGLEAAGVGLAVLFGTLLAGGVALMLTGYVGSFLRPVLHHSETDPHVRAEASRRGRLRRQRSGQVQPPEPSDPLAGDVPPASR